MDYFIFVPAEQELHHFGLHFPFLLTSFLHNTAKIILTLKPSLHFGRLSLSYNTSSSSDV